MLKPYDTYKHFALPWLKTIPSHWDELRNKNVMTDCKDVVGKNSNQYTLLSLTLNGIIARDMVSAKGKFPKEFDTYKIVEKDDIVFCLFDIDETPRTVGISPFNGMLTGAYDVFKISGINKRFLYYYYLSLDNVKAMKPLYTGLRKVINVPVFMGTKLPVPPREEQDKIVCYLDSNLAKINKLIKAQKKQIALLKEQKQAIINQSVTKGLDPKAKMKPSGIEWLGDIPENWEVKRLKTIVNNISQTTNQKETNQIYVGLENIESWTGKIINTKTTTIFDSQAKIYNVGDVLFGKLRPYLAKVAIPQVSGVCSGEFLVLRNSENNVSNEYIALLLRSILLIGIIDSSTYGAKMPRAEWGFISNLKIGIPEFNEQNKILAFIQEKTGVIDRAISVVQKETALLLEYRTSLVSEVITGKVDVRTFEVDDIPIFDADFEEEIEEDDDNKNTDMEE